MVEMRKLREGAAFGISAIALVISVGGLYYSHVQPAHVIASVSEYVDISHLQTASVSLTISITNTGAQAATVTRVAFLVKSNTQGDAYLLEPFTFELLEEGRLKSAELFSPISVPGRTTVAKRILFRSSLARPREYQLVSAGGYNFFLLLWLDNELEPRFVEKFALEISEPDAVKLLSKIDQNTTTTLRLHKWQKWAARTVSEEELRRLVD